MSAKVLFLVTFCRFVRLRFGFDLILEKLIFLVGEIYKKIIKMGLLNKIFGGSNEAKEETVLPWTPLTELRQLDAIKEKSSTKTQVIFKHSTRCGISSMVMRQFVSSYALTEKDLDLYYLDLLNYRDVSNEVGYKFQVMHESPQLLVIKNGIVVAHASHGAINDIDLSQFI